jgi:ketosteroid isomerase-like protein
VSEANVAVVRAIHEDWLAGGRGEQWMSGEIEYVNPAYALESGVIRGPDSFNRVREVWEDFRFEPERYIDGQDGRVVVIGRVHGSSMSGIALQDTMAYVWTIQDGLAVRFQWFSDAGEAHAAAGVSAETD